MKDQTHLYAIVRVDHDGLRIDNVRLAITVKEVVQTQDQAMAEVDRLNKINSDKNCSYFWQVTRLRA